MATKKPSVAGVSDKTPRDFVCMGYRLVVGGKLAMKVGVLDDRGEAVLHTGLYVSPNRARRSTGGVYTGAAFSPDGGTAFDLPKAYWKSQWKSKADVLEWTALTDAADIDKKVIALETDAKRMNEIEAIMLPLRRLYTKAAQPPYDGATMEALRKAVLLALAAPIRKDER